MIGGKVRLYIVGLKDTKSDSHNNPICRRGDKSDYRSDATYSDEVISFKDPELEAKFKGTDSIIHFQNSSIALSYSTNLSGTLPLTEAKSALYIGKKQS